MAWHRRGSATKFIPCLIERGFYRSINLLSSQRHLYSGNGREGPEQARETKRAEAGALPYPAQRLGFFLAVTDHPAPRRVAATGIRCQCCSRSESVSGSPWPNGRRRIDSHRRKHGRQTAVAEPLRGTLAVKVETACSDGGCTGHVRTRVNVLVDRRSRWAPL